MTSAPFHVDQIGIAMAVYRPDPAFFAEQLESIRLQTFERWICVITTDSPLEELLSDSRIEPFVRDERFIWKENRERLGHKKNFERAIQLAAAEGVDAIACSDQDDVWYPRKLAVLAEALQKQGPLSLVHSDLHVYDGEKVVAESVWSLERKHVWNASPRHLFIRNVVSGCSMLFDAELARRYPHIPEAISYHDHWYALVSSTNNGVAALRDPLLAYRQHDSNVLGARPFVWKPDIRAFGTIREELIDRVGRWRTLERLVRAAEKEGVRIGLLYRIFYLSPLDFGFSFYLTGLSNVLRDPPLARLCFRIGIGKQTALVARLLRIPLP